MTRYEAWAKLLKERLTGPEFDAFVNLVDEDGGHELFDALCEISEDAERAEIAPFKRRDDQEKR